MTPEELKEIKDRADKASAEVDALCNRKQWRMCIPAHKDDSDMVLTDSLMDIDKLVAEVERLREVGVQQIYQHTCRLDDECKKTRILTEENARLSDEVEMLRALHTEAVKVRTDRQLELHEQDKEIARLRGALKFYAVEENWDDEGRLGIVEGHNNWTDLGYEYDSHFEPDYGKRARAALGEGEK